MRKIEKMTLKILNKSNYDKIFAGKIMTIIDILNDNNDAIFLDEEFLSGLIKKIYNILICVALG